MTEDDFLRAYDPAAFPRPALTVDLVLMGLRAGRPAVLLTERSQHPHAGRWALPGSFVRPDETLDARGRARAAREGGVRPGGGGGRPPGAALHLRRPRPRPAHAHRHRRLPRAAAGGRLRRGRWRRRRGCRRPASPCPGRARRAARSRPSRRATATGRRRCPSPSTTPTILALAIQRLRGKLDYSDVGFALLPEAFTLRQLQDVHEAILGTSLNKPAFRRRMLDRGWLVPTGAREAGTSFRPAELYRFQQAALIPVRPKGGSHGHDPQPRPGRPAQERGEQPRHPLPQRPHPAERAGPRLLVPAGNREHQRGADGRPRDDPVRARPQPGLPDRGGPGHDRLARRRSGAAGEPRRLLRSGFAPAGRRASRSSGSRRGSAASPVRRCCR